MEEDDEFYRIRENRENKTWEDNEDELLKTLDIEGVSPDTIGRVLGRTSIAITMRLNILAKLEAIKNQPYFGDTMEEIVVGALKKHGKLSFQQIKVFTNTENNIELLDVLDRMKQENQVFEIFSYRNYILHSSKT